ncbi:hypothetical protein TNCV_1738561 [Trichonephila clavipes]|nr:hypothetical protein TNCV_1738561 [Trichonephila clavipes]
MSQGYINTVTTLHWPARSPDLSPIEQIWDHLGCDGLIEDKSGRGRKSVRRDVAKMKVLKDIEIDPKLSAVKLAAEAS